MYPNLQKEWHPTKNGTLTPNDVSYGSNKRAWWLCQTCGHEWNAIIASRSAGAGCPKCGKNKQINSYMKSNPRKFNVLSIEFPELTKEWHPTKNKALRPDKVTPGSSKPAWWMCQMCGHEWEARISKRALRGQGCPKCTREQRTKVRIKNKIENGLSLAEKCPELAKEWHPTKNGDLTPDMITYSSRTKIWWKCLRKGHEWCTTVNARHLGERGCPKCSEELKTSFPEQALFFYFKQVFAECTNRYIFNLQGKRVEADIYIPNLKLAIEYDGELYHRIRFRQDEIKNAQFKELGINLIRIREEGLPNIEMLGFPVFKTDQKQIAFQQVIINLIEHIVEHFQLEEQKRKMIKGLHIDLSADEILIQETFIQYEKKNSLVATNPDLVQEWHPTKNGELKPVYFTPGSNKKVWWLCQTCGHEWDALINSRTKGIGCPNCAGKIATEENCLATVNPELAKEWHPTKNGDFTPRDVTNGSDKKAWWQCSVNPKHEWYATISSRSLNGNGCPNCAGRVVDENNCLATHKPFLLKEWHPIKNGDLTPYNVTPGSNKKAWWQCSKNPEHVWKTAVSDRALREIGCPYCSGYRVTPENCLATVNPELASQWHPTKNGDLTPKDVTKSSSKKVWWKCNKGEDHEWEETVNLRFNGVGCPFCAGRRSSITNRLSNISELSLEWHPTKNGNLTPYDVTIGSSKKVWWRCSINPEHEWMSKIYNRVHGSTCPECRRNFKA